MVITSKVISESIQPRLVNAMMGKQMVTRYYELGALALSVYLDQTRLVLIKRFYLRQTLGAFGHFILQGLLIF